MYEEPKKKEPEQVDESAKMEEYKKKPFEDLKQKIQDKEIKIFKQKNDKIF